MNLKAHLHDWVFHYNHYTQKWDATTRENQNALFNDNSNGVLSSKDIWTLIEIINRTNGNKVKIQKLATLVEKPEKY